MARVKKYKTPEEAMAARIAALKRNHEKGLWKTIREKHTEEEISAWASKAGKASAAKNKGKNAWAFEKMRKEDPNARKNITARMKLNGTYYSPFAERAKDPKWRAQKAQNGKREQEIRRRAAEMGVDFGWYRHQKKEVLDKGEAFLDKLEKKLNEKSPD